MMNCEEEIKDVTQQVRAELVSSDTIRAQQKGLNVLILKRAEPTRRFDGNIGTYRLEYRWLSRPDDVHAVKGSETTIWMMREILPILKGKVGLFDFFDLNG